MKIRALRTISSELVCRDCGISDIRVLEIGHLNGDGGKERKHTARTRFFQDIAYGLRGTDDLAIMCSNCNTLYEHKIGRRLGPPSDVFKLTS